MKWVSDDDHEVIGDDTIRDDDSPVHDRRVAQLVRQGVPRTLADIYADQIDWHQIATLVEHGCAPALALAILL